MTPPVKIDCDGHIPFPPRQVWPILSKTDWLNRSAGLPPVEYTVEPAKAGGSEVEAQAKAFGLKLRWKEMPWEWLEGHFYRVRRIFRGGPFAEGVMGMEFQTTEDGGTFVHVFSEFTPRGLAGALIARHALAPQVRRSMRAAIAHAAEHLRGAAKTTLPNHQEIMIARIEGKKLILELPLSDNPAPSSSGKTLIVAGTGGFVKTTCQHQGKQVSVMVNATVKPQ